MSPIGFFPFKHAADALNNINAVSEGVCSEDLKLFLETNIPKVKYFRSEAEFKEFKPPRVSEPPKTGSNWAHE